MLATRPVQPMTTARSVESDKWNHNQPIQQKDRQMSKERVKWIGTIIFCTVVLCMMIGQFAVVAEKHMQNEKLKVQISAQKEKNANLTDKVTALSSPSRIMAKAREMGMYSTNPGAVAKN